MSDLGFTILDWSVWAPDFDKDSDWAEFDIAAAVASDAKPEVKELPMMQRRRLNRLGRMAMRVTKDIEPLQDQGEGEKPQILNENTYLVFSSRYGDIANTLQLLSSLAVDEPVSPTSFSFSVHNALAGFYSIHSKNHLPHTAISAGQNSFAQALLEAISLIKEDPKRDILLVHYDEPLDEFYKGHNDKEIAPLSVAIRIAATDCDGGIKIKAKDVDIPKVNADEEVLSFVKFLSDQETDWGWSVGAQHWIYTKQ